MVSLFLSHVQTDTHTWIHTNHTLSPSPPNMHLWSHTVRYAPEGVCGKEIHYFSFCLPLLCAAQQLKESDQPTITIHNGFSASSTSLEACLRSGLSPCAPPFPPRLQPLPPLMPVNVCARAGGGVGDCLCIYVCTRIQGHGCDCDSGRPHWKGVESASATGGPWACLITQQQGHQDQDWCRACWLDDLRISMEFGGRMSPCSFIKNKCRIKRAKA